MEGRATGIVLRVRPYSETSLIVHWLTGEQGRIATMARAARRPKSPFRGRLDLFFECDFTFQRSRRSQLHALREVNLVNPHARLREHLGWIEQASYAATLVELVTETDTPLLEIAVLFRDLLLHLPNRPPQARTVFAFELKLLRELGLEPAAVTREETVALTLARRLTDSSWPEIAEFQVSPTDARALHRFLHGVLLHEFGKFARGRPEAIQAAKTQRA